MLELADIVRAAGEVYQRLHGATLLPSHRRALRDIVACRTAALGGHVQACDHCGTRQYSYHSCRNRHCPPSVTKSRPSAGWPGSAPACSRAPTFC
jgi:hypothetical protein